MSNMNINPQVQSYRTKLFFCGLSFVVFIPARDAFDPIARLKQRHYILWIDNGKDKVISDLQEFNSIVMPQFANHVQLTDLDLCNVAIALTCIHFGYSYHLACPDIYEFIIDEYGDPLVGKLIQKTGDCVSWIICIKQSQPRRVYKLVYNLVTGVLQSEELLQNNK
jgi:hypothetical protein